MTPQDFERPHFGRFGSPIRSPPRLEPARATVEFSFFRRKSSVQDRVARRVTMQVARIESPFKHYPWTMTCADSGVPRAYEFALVGRISTSVS